eukprot:scaffold36344_cov56-Cyclotella_meneghiniana.AAC.6
MAVAVLSADAVLWEASFFWERGIDVSTCQLIATHTKLFNHLIPACHHGAIFVPIAAKVLLCSCSTVVGYSADGGVQLTTHLLLSFQVL